MPRLPAAVPLVVLLLAALVGGEDVAPSVHTVITTECTSYFDW